MRDYNSPPSYEFKMLTNNTRYPGHWMTLMKAVMNDYWFDAPDHHHYLTKNEIDDMIHKIYYCWLMQMREMHGEEE